MSTWGSGFDQYTRSPEVRTWRRDHTFAGERWPSAAELRMRMRGDRPMTGGEVLAELDWLREGGLSVPQVVRELGRSEDTLSRVLLSHDDDALFVWRRFIDASGQQGINCSIFRNESPHLASAMILDAETWASARWPGERLYTYVNPDRIRSSNPGYCFKRAGWRFCGQTRGRRPLVILEKTS